MSQAFKLCSSLLLVFILSLALAACQQEGPGVAEREAEQVAVTATAVGLPPEDIAATATVVWAEIQRFQTVIVATTPGPTATIGE